MRAPPLVSDFFEWRWAPCVSLTAGSLAFVALALLLIPVQFEGPAADSSPSRSSGLSHQSGQSALLDRPLQAPPRAVFGASLPRGLAEIGRAAEPSNPGRERPAPPGSNEQAAPTQRGFSPIIDRPDPPPAPPPVVPPPPAPPPPPAVEIAQPQQLPPPPAAGPPPNGLAQPPQQPDPDGPRREVLAQ